MYSQHGEDTFIEQALKSPTNQIHKMVVDIGAGEGEFLSNSKLFIERYNFEALLVELTPKTFIRLKDHYKNNPRVRCRNEAIAGSEYGYELIEDPIYWELNHVTVNPKSSIKTKTLSKLLKEENITDIGLLSIDTEGSDSEIIEELMKNSTIRPQIILIEGATPEHAVRQSNALKEDYNYVQSFSFNHLYSLKGVQS